MYIPVVKHLVLLGGGHAHAIVLRRFAMAPIAGLQITLVTRDIHTPYSGMLPGYIAGHYSYDESHIDLAKLCRVAGVTLIRAEVSQINPEQQSVMLPGRPAIRYDCLSINTGSTPTTHNISGVQKHALIVKPIDIFLSQWEALRQRLLKHSGSFHLVVVGAGASGVELSLCIPYRIQQALEQCDQSTLDLKVTLISRSADILPEHSEGARAKLLKVLQAREVTVITSAEVSKVDPLGVTYCLKHGQQQSLAADGVIWGANAAAPAWPKSSGLEVDDHGFITVNQSLQTPHYPMIFAAGDVASLPESRPKSGVFAVRQGPVLAHNLRAFLFGKPLRRYKPQTRYLALLTTGNRYAVASRGGWSAQGAILWRWKDMIDRRFMRMFEMPVTMAKAGASDTDTRLLSPAQKKTLHQHAMRCGGCGAKVSASSLQRVLQRLKEDSPHRAALDDQIGDDAALLEHSEGEVLLQSVDYFRAFIGDPYRFGAIAANHALGDVYAMGGRPVSALAIATLPFASEEIVEDQLHAMLAGALSMLEPANAMLSGGHSSEGAEMAFGLTVNGSVAPERAWRKSHAKAGDVLVLTKALGTGVLMAADMQAKARGRWVESALQTMLLSHHAAVTCLRALSVNAATDITGFGLVGHLLEICRASNCHASLNLEALPLMEGALDMLEQGITSSLQPHNLNALQFCDFKPELLDAARLQLAFDPQTAGGLLLSIPLASVDLVVAELQQAGYSDTSIIGNIRTGGEGIAPVSLI